MEKETITFNQLEEFVYEKFEVKDFGVVRLICATVLANKKLDNDPVWLFIIAPPSGLKTELINAFEGIKGIYGVSSLTTHTLISGQKAVGRDTSLLLQIEDERGSYRGIFTFKDFTSVLEMNKIARDEILSQLREIYDGSYRKSFGTGETLEWKGKVGFIAGVTEAVDIFQGMYNILGERFMQYRMTQPSRKGATRKGIKNSHTIEKIRQEMKELFASYINNFKTPDSIPEIPDDWFEEIVDLSNFATLARSGVMRDPFLRDITNVFSPEMPIRFAKQLATLAQMFILMGSRDSDRIILRKIAFSSISKNRMRVFHFLSQERVVVKLAGRNIVSGDRDKDDYGLAQDTIDSEEEWTTKSIAVAMGLPTNTARRVLQDINAQGFIIRGKSGSADTWVLADEYKEFFQKYYDEKEIDVVGDRSNFPENNTGMPTSQLDTFPKVIHEGEKENKDITLLESGKGGE